MEEKHIFAKKKHKKTLFRKLQEKKSHKCGKKHKKAHVLFKSTLYDPCIIKLIDRCSLVSCTINLCSKMFLSDFCAQRVIYGINA